jgi:hypothetical protein
MNTSKLATNLGLLKIADPLSALTAAGAGKALAVPLKAGYELGESFARHLGAGAQGARLTGMAAAAVPALVAADVGLGAKRRFDNLRMQYGMYPGYY